MNRVALYARVSTEEQAEGFSLDMQLGKMRSYADIKGWTVAGEYVDEGQSGRTVRRPAYQRMMDEMATWDSVLVLKMDRIHRNSRNFAVMVEHLQKRGKQFVSVMESLDTSTAIGRFVMDMIVRVAQLESEQTGERTKADMLEKAKQGEGGLGGPAPYGYEWHEGVLRPVEAEAAVVRRIFSMAKEMQDEDGKVHFGEIADSLNDRRLRTRSGKPWSYWSVKRLHGNPVYRGDLHWDSVVQKNVHPPLVKV